MEHGSIDWLQFHDFVLNKAIKLIFKIAEEWFIN